MTALAGSPRRRGAAEDRQELEAERQRLLSGLRDIESDHLVGDLTDDDYRSLRNDYTVRAADVLRRIEALDADPPDAEAPGAHSGAEALAAHSGAEAPGPEPVPRRGFGRRLHSRRLRIGVAAAGLVFLGVGAGLLAVGSSGSRQPGQTVSGAVPPSPAQELVAARHAMATGDQVMALRLYQAVLSVEPNQPEALAYSGWLLRLSGDVQHNKTLIDAAVADERAAEAADPAYPDPHFFLGLILLDDLHDPTAAIPQLTAYLGASPTPAVRQAVAPVLARARQEAGQPGG